MLASVSTTLENRTVDVERPATARRRSELENRGRLRHGQLSSPWRSGRRFANFQRQRAPAGPSVSVFRANAPRTPSPPEQRARGFEETASPVMNRMS
eukprot:scaffold7289_cov24-Phaeocystis_antarctica.AAC.1